MNFLERVIFVERRQSPVSREISDYDDSHVDYDKDHRLALKYAPTSDRAHAAVIRHTARLLKHVDHPAAAAAAGVNPRDPHHLQLLSDVVNAAAKSHTKKLYKFKHHIVHGAVRHGAKGAWGGKDNDVFYLHTEKGGTSTFHDPTTAAGAKPRESIEMRAFAFY